MIYPPRCLTCGDMVESDFGLCGGCWRDTAFVGGLVCDACGVPLQAGGQTGIQHCDTCLGSAPPWTRGRAAMIYRDTGRKMVLALKHGDRHEIARPAAKWMAHAAADILTLDTLIAPIPLHWTRLVKRRFNQSALLSKELSRISGLPWCPDLLERHRKTVSLEGLNWTERHETVQNAMRVHRKRRHRLIGRPVLLVDDVMTTGATLGAATRACLAAGSGPVCVLTLARVTKDT
ncbi:ComF family protein [Sulfitobacter sp. S190]|nr:ComF family protein [Sulfitobacter sp. S190]